MLQKKKPAKAPPAEETSQLVQVEESQDLQVEEESQNVISISLEIPGKEAVGPPGSNFLPPFLSFPFLFFPFLSI